jgi:photosystem II stability/assembly factor-like uncharacterized protein
MQRTHLPIIPFLIFLSVLLAVFRIPALSQSPEIFYTYLPLIDGPPPEHPAWIGPDGGYITAVAIAPPQPEIIFAGTWGSGIFKSSDGGVTWHLKSQGLGNWYVQSMAVDPHNAEVVYAGTYTGKLYKSINGGEFWFQSSTNIQENAIVYSIAIDPLDPQTMYIGTRGVSNNGYPPWKGVLYRSTDAGANWIPALTNVAGPSEQDWAYGVTVHPRNPSWVFAATHEHGVYRSTDFGLHWQPINNGITNYSARSIVVDPHSPKSNPTIYMGPWKYSGIFKSVNGGESWFLQNSSAGNRIYSLSIDPVDSENVYASVFPGGVLKTMNGGENWFITGLQGREVINTAINPKDPRYLYSGTNGNGLFMSADRGNTWQLRQKGLHATRVSALQVSAADSQWLFTAVRGAGVLQSLDGGQNWTRLGTDIGDDKILGLVSPPENPEWLFALTENAGLHRCNLQPGGTCWEKVNIDFPALIHQQIAYSPTHPFTHPPLLVDENKTPRLPDADPPLLSLVFAPSNPQIAYLGTAGAGLYKSMDGGFTWNPAGFSGSKIVSVVVDADNPYYIFAATETGVWVSNNAGVNWYDTGLAGVTIYALALGVPTVPYAATDNGVYWIASQGWEHLALTGIVVTALNAHPTEPGWLYAGADDGLRISRDAGHNWVTTPPQLTDVTVAAISFDPSDPVWVYISTATHGVMRIKDE